MDYSSDYSSYTSTPTSASFGLQGMLATIMSAVSTFLILIIAVVVLTIIGQWKAYQKAGRKGYESLIPYHRDWVQLQLAGLEGYLVFLQLLVCIPFIGWIVYLGINIWWDIELAKSYGRSTGFGVGLALLPCVFWPMLGFGKAQYVGPASKGGVNGTQTAAQAPQVNTAFAGQATLPQQNTQPVQPTQPVQNTVFPQSDSQPVHNTVFTQSSSQPVQPTQNTDTTTVGDQNN